jgi:hypothetical protein
VIEIKKSMLTLGSIIVLIVLISISYQPLVADEKIEQIKRSLDENQIIEYNPPNWINIEFNGTWGISIGFKPDEELGTLEGLMRMSAYEEPMRRYGVIEAELPVQNECYYLNGYTVSYFILGLVSINNNTFYVGFGNFYEDGTFYYNLYLFTGISWYIEGTWREINNN